ncbi:MAG TPA: type II toxin-antitoxin system VapC family toxin [Acidimicrobiia bacterium]|nr:type II toxin-antitoxin system VapC family toxin [Acidimicrobiia bacterium]
MIFADSSALAKKYLDEIGSDFIRSVSQLHVSSLAHVECTSALWKRYREKTLSLEDVRELAALLDADWLKAENAFRVYAVTEEVVALACIFAGKYQLRAYDAVQLAQASIIQKRESRSVWFLSFDKKLNKAAQREGFIVIGSVRSIHSQGMY